MYKIVSVLIILALATLSCNDIKVKTIKDNQELWEAYKSDRYAFDYGMYCFCPFLDSMRLVVNGDSIEAVLHSRTGDLYLIEADSTYALDVYGQDYFNTIDDIFEEINEYNGKATAGEVTATFDEDHGFPLDVSIDRLINAVDDEVTYKIRNVEVF